MLELHKVFNPRSIAFFGASNNPTTMGTGELAFLIMAGFKGKIYPVHPSEKKVLGIDAYKSVSELPEVPDLAVMVLPTSIVPPILDECGRAGISAAIVVSGGFKEIGGEGEKLEREIEKIARKHGITLIGPNCMGVGHFEIGLNTTYSPYDQKPGGVTIISQSGTYASHVFGYTKQAGIGLSHSVSVGNSAVVDISDCLEYFADEPSTKAIALYVEGINDGEKFMRAAKKATSKKAVVAYYVGGSKAGARAGLSHTGALAGDDAIYDGVFRETGIIRAYDIEELLTWSWAFSNQPLPAGPRVCILSHSGGPAASIADRAERDGLEVPIFSAELQKKLRELVPMTAAVSNPVDLTFYMDVASVCEEIPRILCSSGEIDALVIYLIFGSFLLSKTKKALGKRLDFPADSVIPDITGYLSKFVEIPHDFGIPVIASSFWSKEDEGIELLCENGIPVFNAPERAVDAVSAMWRVSAAAKEG
ncbi:MAG: CoA-binding protein [Actinomycetota bacterium]|nr:CoA-binding protein [Actinomycetota bacterium]